MGIWDSHKYLGSVRVYENRRDGSNSQVFRRANAPVRADLEAVLAKAYPRMAT
jgi:hypothetical protein